MRLPGVLALLAVPASAQGVGFERTDHPFAGDARWVEAGDVDADGELDLVAACFEADSVAVLFGVGGGAFGTPGFTAAGAAPTCLGLGDVTGDGRLDALVGHAVLPRLWLLRGTDDPGGSAFAPAPGPVGGAGAVSVELADLDLDGDLDAVVGNEVGADVRVLLGDGAGGFAAAVSYAADAPVLHVAIGDTDVDGDPDLVAARGFPFFSPLVLENGGVGAFEAVGGSSMSGSPRWIALGDLTSDGLPDAVSPTDDGLSTILEVADNTGGNQFSLLSLLGSGETRTSELGDFDGDGHLDHLALGFDGVVRVLFGDGTGVGSVSTVSTPAPEPAHMVLADLDGDGALDFATANGGAEGLSVLRNVECSPPEVESVEPSSVPAVTLGPAATVFVEGCGLSFVTSVLVDGVPAESFQTVGDQLLRFDVPLVPAVGAVEVELVTAAGSTGLPLEVLPLDPPLLELEGALPAFLDPAEPATVTLGGAPGNAAFLFASPDLLPTVLPGLLELEIGLGGASLVVLSGTLLGPSAWTQQELALGGLPPGFGFHLQGAVLPTLASAPPLTPTNVQSAAIQP